MKRRTDLLAASSRLTPCCAFFLILAGLWPEPASAQSSQGFYLRQEIGFNTAPGVELLGNSTDRASRCDEFINPR